MNDINIKMDNILSVVLFETVSFQVEKFYESSLFFMYVWGISILFTK